MVAVSTIVSPPCGLYRTTRPLPGADAIPAGILVNLHTHDEPPLVYVPKYNSFNRWEWDKTPHPVPERGWLESLRPLPEEGYYVLRARLEFPDGAWPARSLVQLGFDRAGNGLLFLAQRRFQRAENTLFFGERGVPVDSADLAMLEPLVVFAEPDPEAAGAEAQTAAT